MKLKYNLVFYKKQAMPNPFKYNDFLSKPSYIEPQLYKKNDLILSY